MQIVELDIVVSIDNEDDVLILYTVNTFDFYDYPICPNESFNHTIVNQ